MEMEKVQDMCHGFIELNYDINNTQNLIGILIALNKNTKRYDLIYPTSDMVIDQNVLAKLKHPLFLEIQ